jgi:hypothetical protein
MRTTRTEHEKAHSPKLEALTHAHDGPGIKRMLHARSKISTAHLQFIIQ